MRCIGEMTAEIADENFMEDPVADNTMNMWNCEEYEDFIGHEDPLCAACALSVIATDENSKYRCKNTRCTEISIFWLFSVNKGRNSRVNSR